jgi:CO/xanthine dehydrogenase Mo-binding subunit
VSTISRRSLLGAGGALIVSIAGPGAALAQGKAVAKPAPDQLDTFLAIRADGNVVAYFGKPDVGQGVDVAIRQIVAEELDVAVGRVSLVMSDTEVTVNQGGASGSTGIERGGVTMRYAGAEARRVLLDMAAQRLGVAADALRVDDGVVSVAADPARRVTYAELIGDRRFDVPMQWNGEYGNTLLSRGRAEPKKPAEYRVVGTSVPRTDIPEKVFAKHAFVTDVRVPGMLHGRMVRPAVAGSVPAALDTASIGGIPGARVVWKGGFLGVVAPREWDAIRAAQELRVTWSQTAPPFPGSEAVYDHIRAATPVKREETTRKGDAAAAIAGAARVVEAEYEWPFQSHASMGPACVVVDARTDGATVWTGTQKPHFARDGVAAILGLKPGQVHGIWVRGPGSYGRNDAGDAAMDAAVLSQAVGAPVRVQYSRDQGHGWDPKGPASVHRVRAGLDAGGTVVGYQFESRGFSRTDIDTTERDPAHSLAGQLMGAALKSIPAFGVPAEPYVFPAQLRAWETIAPLLDRASPLRSAHLRDPVGPQINFAAESFIDELAHATGSDPVAFRLAHLENARGIAVIRACADKFGWQPRVAASARAGGPVVTGRGFAYTQRGGTIVAIAVEVEVNRANGGVRPRRFAVAHDCGLVVNPVGLRLCIEGNVMQGVSRSLFEEVTFDKAMVTSLDWTSYPILDLADMPDALDIVLINRPEVPPSGAGESSIRPVAAALANAIFDATGVRVRRAPLSPERRRSANRRA